MCISPIRIRNPAKFPKTPFVDVPCGKCVECLKKRYNDLNFRLQNEFSMAKKPCYFFTLTYAPEFLPWYCVDENSGYIVPYPRKEDVSGFVRSLRDKIRYELKKQGFKNSQIKEYTNFKYYICSELGDKNLRPHFHGLIYNFPFTLDYFRLFLREYWTKGFITADYLNSRRIGYTIKYLLKDQFILDDYYPDLDQSLFKVRLSSKGIGDFSKEQYRFLRQNKTFMFENENGKKVTIPKYYRDKLFIYFPQMKLEWSKYVAEFHDQTPESTIDNNHRYRVYEKSSKKFYKHRKEKKDLL